MNKVLILSKLLEEKNSIINQIFFDKSCCTDFKNLNSGDDILESTEYTIQELRLDTVKTYKTYKFLLTQIALILNKHHKKKYSQRFWEILIGPWLNVYIKIFYNRIKTIEKAFSKYQFKKIRIGNFENYDFSTNETGGFFESTINLEWDMMFKSRAVFELAKHYKNLNFEKIYFQRTFYDNFNHNAEFKKKKVKYILSIILEKLSLFKFSPNIVMDETYFGLKKELFFQILLGQFPFIFKPININYPKKNAIIRKELKEIFSKNNDYFINILQSNLFDDLPIIFIEAFNQLKEKIEAKNLPKNIRVIFTSNSFFLNESFKYFTAANIDNSKYFVGQHGSSYGSHITHQFLPEVRTCDNFISWGQKDKKKDKPLYNFKKNIYKPNSQKKNILIVNRTLGYPVETWDKIEHYYQHFEKRNFFLKSLSYKFKKNLVFRLHYSFKQRFPNEIKIIKEIHKDVHIDEGKLRIDKLLNKSKLIIFTYYSTGFLELIFANTPVLCMEENLLFKIKKRYIYLFKEMIENKILFTNFDSLSNFINNNNYETIYNRWHSEKISKLRLKFSNIFCKKSNHKDLKVFLEFLKKNIN